MSKVVALKDSFGGSSNIETVNPDEIGDAIASIGSSEIAQQIIQDSAEEIGLTLPDSIDWDSIDYAAEGETVSTVIEVYQNTNGGTQMPSSDDCVNLAEALGNSDIAAEIIDDIDVQIPTDDATKAQIENALQGLPQDKINNILALFN